MNILRYDTLLSNAIDLMLPTMDRKEICRELGMTNKEFESIGDSLLNRVPIMNPERYDTLLFNAIDFLLQTMNREEICKSIGMAIDEFESVGNSENIGNDISHKDYTSEDEWREI